MTEPPAIPESPRSASVAVGNLWNERRWRLFHALGHQSELFADLYRRGIDALNERPLTPGAIVVAGHCIRDLANGLPDVLGDAGEIPAYVDMTAPTRDLASIWEDKQAHLGPLHASIPIDGAPDGPEPLMSVPVVLAEAARRVAAASRTASDNNQRRRSALVLGRQESRPDATVKIFVKSVRAFEIVRHPGRGREIDLDKAVARIDKALPIIEATLEARIGRFFESVEDLMDVISAANQRTEAGEQ
ncbi:hypothetical protein [Nocardioides speluncae]|uniref:hypothetical protein n=1 Tax=Nocardioides speluncae TaxID=2670337 RepID=UPI0012B170AB|nr:hypothetical protein [Nocardioides speluncae]